MQGKAKLNLDVTGDVTAKIVKVFVTVMACEIALLVNARK
jgi:hypothetical protein